MSLSRRAAAVRGDDFHHAVAWLWVCRMLHAPETILTVSVEDAEGGAFDDVVVRRRVGGNVFIQAKSSNYGNKIIDGDWLLTAAAPGGKSPLRRFYDTYLRLSESGERFTLELWTNRGFDHVNPLLGGLLDQKHDKIATDQMLAAGTRSAVGKERDAWAGHLGASVADLARFLDTVRWKQTGSELDVREQAKPLMRLAGLRSDDGAVGIGINVVRGWVSDGLSARTAADVGRCVAEMGLAALDRLSASSPSDARSAESRLPPECRERVEALREASPGAAGPVVHLLSQRSARVPGVLARFADVPLEWMLVGGFLVWEALAAFVQAHRLPGLSEILARAIEAESPRSSLHRVRVAVVAANEEGDLERAEELLREVPPGDALAEAVKAQMSDDAEAVIDVISASIMHRSDDPDLALYGSELLGWAYWHLGELESALGVLRQASERSPGRGFLVLQQARFKLALADRSDDHGSRRHDLFESAVEMAIRARDEFRIWHGPSGQAVAVAASALLALNQPERVCQMAMARPEGEAEPQEADDAGVVEPLAHALLHLGRIDELDKLDLELVGGSEEALIRALQARDRGDADAVDLMRAAVEHAEDDRSRLMALEGLTLFGETHEAALASLDPGNGAESDRIRAMAAYERGDYAAGSELLMPHRCSSAEHAELLAACQRRSGALEQACETLLECAEALDDPSLYGSAVRRLIDAERYEKAESVALGALARNPSRVVESRLRRALLEIAEALQDWPSMEQYGRDLFGRFPDLPMGPWAVVYALYRQAKHREAWGYLVEHDLSPDNDGAALVAISVYVAMDAPAQDADRLLRTARSFSESEEVAGNAIGALMIGKGGRVPLSDHQLSEFRDLIAGFEERFPESTVLRRRTFDGGEQWLETVRSQTEQHSFDVEPILRDVRHGRLPYGMLQTIAPLPYAESLQLQAAGYLTAVSADDETRKRERAAASDSLGMAVAVDTSVAALGMHARLDVVRMGAAFHRVLIADELLTDARDAVTSAGTPAAAYAGYEPLVDDVVVSRVEPEELEQAVEAVQQVAATLSCWQRVVSSRLQFAGRVQHPGLRPWDSSLRVASSKDCPLWCDDVALRRLAESEGIPTFGTYALYEVLALQQGNDWLPSPVEMKMRLLRAQIADVPISLQELCEAADDSDGPDVAVGSYLGRPFSWLNPSETFAWYQHRVEMMMSTSSKQGIPGLLFNAAHGLGSAVGPEGRQAAMGRILAASLWTVQDPTMSPMLLMCSRFAARRIDPVADVDPLPDAVAELLAFLENELDAGTAAQSVTSIFSHAEPADRLTVASLVVGDR